MLLYGSTSSIIHWYSMGTTVDQEVNSNDSEIPVRVPEVVLAIENETLASPTTTAEKEWDPNHYKEKEKCTIFCPCKFCYVSTRICCFSCKDCCKVLCCQSCFPPPKPSWNKSFYLTTSIVRNIVFAIGELRSLTGIRFLTSGGVPPSSPLLPRGLFSKLGDSLEKDSALPAYEYIYSHEAELEQLFSSTTPITGSRHKIILYFHGGAFCWQSLASHRMMLYAMAKDTGATILSIEYRKAPEYPHPLPGQDCFEAYKWLLQKIGDSSRIVVAGDSAGGALAIDVVLMARDAQLPRPAGSILLSPWVDLIDDYNPSLVTNQPFDVIPAYLIPYVGSMYIDPSKANSVSAINRDLRDFPPVLIEVGDSEILQDQIMKLVEKLRSDGALSSSSAQPYVECNTYPDMVHVFQMLVFSNMPQISLSFQRMKAFLEKLDILNNCVAPAVSEMEIELTSDESIDRV